MTQTTPVAIWPQASPVLQVPVAIVPEPQHGCPMAPHAWQRAGVVVPAGSMQRRLAMSQVPAPPPVAGQQSSPAPPQVVQVMPPSAVLHAPPGWQVSPGQQVALSAPHMRQMFGPVPGGFAQPRPVPQALPVEQHSWFSPPQGRQASPPSPAWQDRLAPHSFAPLQQAWPEPPQGWQAAGVVGPGGFTQRKPVLHPPLPPVLQHA